MKNRNRRNKGGDPTVLFVFCIVIAVMIPIVAAYIYNGGVLYI